MNRTEDPVLVSARREAVIVFCIWLTAMMYTITACWMWGYNRDPATIRFIAGFPDWVFYGIICPWVACFGVAYVFSHWVMRDEALGEDVGSEWDEDLGEEPAHG